MSGLKKLLRRKGGKSKQNLSTEDLSDRGSLAGSEASYPGYFVGREKDLPKLHKAVWAGDLAKVKQVAKKGDINQLDKENRTALHLACAQGNNNIVGFLLDSKAKSSLCDNAGRTPLMKAVECQFLDCVKTLLERGAVANVVDVNNSTPLHLASANGDIDVAVLLLEREAQINGTDKEGFTALHVASSLGNQDFVSFLLDEGANIDAVDISNRTSLMTAAGEGHIAIVRLLLENNSNTDMKDKQGWKASDHAVINGHHSVANIIDEYDEKRAETKRHSAASGVKNGGRKGLDLSKLLGSGGTAAADEVEFSFGSPAVDVGAESTSARDEESASHHSAENSWESSDDDMFSTKKKSSKPSLMAALKPVTRSESDVSAKNGKGAPASRIPVRSESIKSTAGQEPSRTAPGAGQTSRLPLRVPGSQSPTSDVKKEQTSPHQSHTKFASSPSLVGSPKRSLPDTPEVAQRSVESKPKPLTSQRQDEPSSGDEDSQISDTDVLAALSGGRISSKPKEAKVSKDKKVQREESPEPLAGSASLSLSLSSGDGNEDESFTDPPLDDEEPLTRLTSTLSKTGSQALLSSAQKAVESDKEKLPQKQDKKAVDNKGIPKLNIELDSPVSSVSDPDVSGLSDGVKKKSAKQEKAAGLSESEESDWDSSDDILPSDGPDTSRGSNLFGSGKLSQSPSKPPKSAAEGKNTGTETQAKESESELSESESEWEKERTEKKKKEKERVIQQQKHLELDREEERRQEEGRRLEWQREQQEREDALAKEVQAELEMEMQMERLEREAEAKREKEEEERKRDEEKKEEQRLRMDAEERRREEERLQRDAEKRRREKERLQRDAEERREEERLRMDAEERRREEERLRRNAEERGRKEEEERRRERERRELEEERRLRQEERVERERIEREKEDELERQLRLKEEDRITMERELEQERRHREDELHRIEQERGEDRRRLEQQKEEELERQMRLKEEEMELQRKAFEAERVQERQLSEQMRTEEAEEMARQRYEALRYEEEERRRLEEQNAIKEEENQLLEAYRRKQEDLLEKERRFEEELIRRERELEERKRLRDEQMRAVEEQMQMDEERLTYAAALPEDGFTDWDAETGVDAGVTEAEHKHVSDLEELKHSLERSIERERSALVESMSRRKEEERQAEAAAVKLRQSRDELKKQEEELKQRKTQRGLLMREEEEMRRIQDALRGKRLEEEQLEKEQRAKRLEAEESAMHARIEIEKLHLQELELSKGLVEEQASAKLAELNNRQRKEELEHKSRQIRQEREELSATFEAAKQRTSELSQEPAPLPTRLSLTTSGLDYNPSALTADNMRNGKAIVREDGQQIKPTPSNENQALANGYGYEGDWTDSSGEEERAGAYSPLMAMLASGSTRLPPGQTPLRSQSPLAKSSALNMTGGLGATLNGSMTFQDPQSIARLQEAFRESKRQVDKQRERLISIEAARKQQESEMAELHRRVENLTREKSDVERAKLEMEVESRSLRYKHEQEKEARRVAESLQLQLKEQISRLETKLVKEMETRQKLETDKRHFDVESKDLKFTVQQLDADVKDLKKSLAEEQEARSLQAELYIEEKRKSDALTQETRQTSHQKAQVLSQLEAVDHSRKTYEENSGNLREELKTAQVDLVGTKTRLEAMQTATSKEIETLKAKLQKKSEKLARTEEALAQARADHDIHMVSGKNEQQQLNNKLDSESTSRKGLEAEVSSLRSRLEKSDRELETSNISRVESDRQLQTLRDELYKTKLRLEKEVSTLKEANKSLLNKLDSVENRAYTLDTELQTANMSLTERGGHVNLVQREIEQNKSHLERMKEKLAREREQNAKHVAKLESNEQQVLSLRGECDSLRRQLELSNEKVKKQEELTVRAEEKFHAMLTSMRDDFDKSKQVLSEKQENLQDTISRLKDDVSKKNDKAQREENENKQLQKERNDLSIRLAQSDAALEMQTKVREELEDDRTRLRQLLQRLETKVSSTEVTSGEIAGHATRLEEELEHTMRVQDETSQRLATKSMDIESVTKSLHPDTDEVEEEEPAQLEQTVNKLKVEKAQAVSSLREEESKCNLLLREIKDSNQARQQLESLLSNVKGESVMMEEKLQSESLTKTQHAREAEEAKELWEAEVRSRTKLGGKIAEMEKRVASYEAALNEEKRKTRKALEIKKVLEAKLEAMDGRSDQHHKEVVALKTQLKSYKRRLKEYESSQNRLPTLRADFDKERAAMESHIISLRRQIDHLNERLREEMETRSRVELTSKQQQQELSAAKAQEKRVTYEMGSLEQANRLLEEEVSRSKSYYEHNYVEKGQLEAYKQELEAKSRFELNRKLEEVNAHLEEQALAREALDKVRAEGESKSRKDLEQTVANLKMEIAKMRAELHENQVQRDTFSTEVDRYKDWYESELKTKEKLTNRLMKANEKVAESKAVLNFERSRRAGLSDNFVRDQSTNSPYKYTGEPGEGIFNRSATSPDRMYSKGDDQLMKAVENELNKSIKRHLDTAPLLSDVDLKPTLLSSSEKDSSSYSPLAASSKEYMSVLRKNYFV